MAGLGFIAVAVSSLALLPECRGGLQGPSVVAVNVPSQLSHNDESLRTVGLRYSASGGCSASEAVYGMRCGRLAAAANDTFVHDDDVRRRQMVAGHARCTTARQRAASGCGSGCGTGASERALSLIHI